MNDKVYIVIGYCGEYSDRQEWRVKAFLKKENADELCKKLNDWCGENKVSYYGDCSGIYYDLKNPFDEHFSSDYTGTNYLVEEVPLEYL